MRLIILISFLFCAIGLSAKADGIANDDSYNVVDDGDNQFYSEPVSSGDSGGGNGAISEQIGDNNLTNQQVGHNNRAIVAGGDVYVIEELNIYTNPEYSPRQTRTATYDRCYIEENPYVGWRFKGVLNGYLYDIPYGDEEYMPIEYGEYIRNQFYNDLIAAGQCPCP